MFAALAPGSRLRRMIEFGPATRRRTYQKIGQMVKNGMPIISALDALESQQRDRGPSRATLATILQRWKRGMLNGDSLDKVAEGDLPQSDIVLLRAGIQSGQLHRAVENVLFLQDAVKMMRGAIIGGLAYPTALMLIAFGIMNFVTYVMVPVYAEFSPPETWTGAAGALAGGAWFVANVLPWLAILVIIALISSLWSLPRWTGEARVKFEFFPPWSVYKLFNGTAFLVALAGLVREGVKVKDALDIIGQKGTPWFTERIRAARRLMEDGEKIASALFKSGYQFPDREIVDDLRSYETFDNFDQMIDVLAREALDVALGRIKTQMNILRNIGMATFGAVLIWYIAGLAGMNAMVQEMANK